MENESKITDENAITSNGVLGEVTLTDAEFKLIGHSLGVNTYHAKVSKKKKDKILPKEFYRNYFCASVNHSDFPILSDLQLKGLMESWTKFDNLYFGVTEKGIQAFKNVFDKYVKG